MIGKELKMMRIRLGFSQKKLANEFGISTRQIVNLEKGTTPVKELYVEKITLLGEKQGNQANVDISDFQQKLDFSDREIEIIFAYRELNENEQEIFYHEIKAAVAREKNRLKISSH